MKRAGLQYEKNMMWAVRHRQASRKVLYRRASNYPGGWMASTGRAPEIMLLSWFCRPGRL
jgi:hypothetical protein